MEAISAFSVLLPLALGLIFFERLELNSRVITVLLVFASASQIAAFYLDNKSYKWACFNVYSIVDLVAWGYIFYRNNQSKKIRAFIAVMIALQVTIAVILFGVVGISKQFFTLFVCLNSFLQLSWVLSFFYVRYKRENIDALEKEPMFWYCLGILIYAPTTYFLFAYYEFVKTDFPHLWSIHHLLNTFMYLMFSIGICTNIKESSKFRNVFSRFYS